MPFLRFTRDKRGYEHTYLLHANAKKGGAARLLYWYRSPPGIRVGRSAFDESVRQALETQYPWISFDWPKLMSTPLPPPDVEHWRERRRAEKAARQARQAAERERESPDVEPSEEAADEFTTQDAPGQGPRAAAADADEPTASAHAVEEPAADTHDAQAGTVDSAPSAGQNRPAEPQADAAGRARRRRRRGGRRRRRDLVPGTTGGLMTGPSNGGAEGAVGPADGSPSEQGRSFPDAADDHPDDDGDDGGGQESGDGSGSPD